MPSPLVNVLNASSPEDGPVIRNMARLKLTDPMVYELTMRAIIAETPHRRCAFRIAYAVIDLVAHHMLTTGEWLNY